MVYLLDFAITFLVYSLPIIIYRYAIKKAPVENKLALKISVIYAICAGIVMAVILYNVNGHAGPGAALLLWAVVNYNVLKPHVTQITFDDTGKKVMYESTGPAAATPESLESKSVKSESVPISPSTASEVVDETDSTALLMQLQHKERESPIISAPQLKHYPRSAKIIIAVLAVCIVVSGLVCYMVGVNQINKIYYTGYIDGIESQTKNSSNISTCPNAYPEGSLGWRLQQGSDTRANN